MSPGLTLLGLISWPSVLVCLLGREASWQAEVLVDGIFLSCAISAELRVEIEMLWLSAVSVTTETRLALARGWMAGYFF